MTARFTRMSARQVNAFFSDAALLLLLCAMGMVVIALPACSRKPAPPDGYEKIFNELTSVESTFRNLTPDPTGVSLAYIRATKSGRTLFLLDLKSLTPTRIETSNEVTQIYGWSPDGHYLAMADAEPAAVDENHILIFDKNSHSITPLTGARGKNEGWFYWLATNHYYFARQGPDRQFERFIGDWDAHTSQKVVTYLQDFTPISEHFGAFIYQGNIKSCQIDSLQNPPVKTESNFATNQFDPIENRWLRYDRESGTFLFCAVPKGSEWRYLYSFCPKTSTLAQLSDLDTYNGQWLPENGGYACVGNISNHFHLAVRPKDPADATNLFLNGIIANYTVAPSGDRIYMTGAQDIEPQSIWEYNIGQHRLRCLVPGIDHPFVSAQLIEPHELHLMAPDGVAFTSFVYPPREMAGRSKHPLLIGVPPPSAQAQKSFGTQSQLLPNLGFEVAAVNYRGVDGYGRKFSALKDDIKAAGDVITAYRELVKDPGIDANNVFLFDTSGGSEVTTELVAQHPELWRGIVLDHSILEYTRLDPRTMPPVFYFTGDQDFILGSAQALDSWGKENKVKVSGIVWPHTGHYLWKTEEFRETGRQILAFYYDTMK